jgi:ribosomal RNA-processing protein 36
MASIKRKSLDDDLYRRVRARRESSEELDSISSQASSNGGHLKETSEESDSEEEGRVGIQVSDLKISLILF